MTILLLWISVGFYKLLTGENPMCFSIGEEARLAFWKHGLYESKQNLDCEKLCIGLLASPRRIRIA